MDKIQLNNWELNKNSLFIFLSKFKVKINILKNDQFIYYQTIIKDNLEKELTFNFYAIEDAITFIEKVVSKCKNNQEIINKYEIMFDNNEFKLPYEKEDKEEKINLTKDDAEKAIINFFKKDENDKLSVYEKLSLNKPNVMFYLIQKSNDIETKTLLTENDLRDVLNSFVNFYDYELIDFKYIGGVHRVGYFFNEDTPHFDGIQLIVIPKVKEKNLDVRQKRLKL